MKKIFPKLKNDQAVKGFLKKDLADFMDRNQFVLTFFELAPKNKSVTLRLSEDLLKAVKLAAQRRGMNYQRLVRLAVERFIREEVT